MTALEALDKLRKETIECTYDLTFDKNQCCRIIEGHLVALQILKTKRIDLECLKTYNEYASYVGMAKNSDKINKIEFEILKEAL